mmetsp:Transcript_3191/g.11139  ORF Transcript_3191/g.11139 Transcript_3191/m.11139 type:complete len:210 (-) Transcript_3191:290-919(-)
MCSSYCSYWPASALFCLRADWARTLYALCSSCAAANASRARATSRARSSSRASYSARVSARASSTLSRSCRAAAWVAASARASSSERRCVAWSFCSFMAAKRFFCLLNFTVRLATSSSLRSSCSCSVIWRSSSALRRRSSSSASALLPASSSSMIATCRSDASSALFRSSMSSSALVSVPRWRLSFSAVSLSTFFFFTHSSSRFACISL